MAASSAAQNRDDADDHLVGLEAILAARELVAGRVHRTPMLSSATAAVVLGKAGEPPVAGGTVHVKAENLQVTGSFKPRGMINKVASLTADERARGIVTLSAGNAAQAYAWAGRDAGVHATVVMPEKAVRSKVDACLGYGAEVVLHGAHVGETLARVNELVAERGLVYCHPFDDPAVIAGHGSVGLEILEDLPDVDVVVVGVGGGGLISGIATAVKERRPQARVYGVEPDGANAMSLAFERGEVVTMNPATVADGLAAPFAGAWTLAICRHYLDGLILLDDPTILAGMRFAAERMKQVLEPAGAAALAALLFGQVPVREGDRVCVVASGGNVEIGRIGALMDAAVPLPT
ncbi:MAG: threonine/serine dehydratase [Candidatus Limnocylindrales bacterium]